MSKLVRTLQVDGKMAGFAFVRFISEGEDGYYSIAEFFVMRKYRKFGIGKKVAFYLFEMFNGNWEVAETFENIPAQKFWRRIIGEYTNEKFEDVQREEWNGFIQRFSSLRKGKI